MRPEEITRKSKCRREDNINMDLKDVRWEDVYWIHKAMSREQ
jgi:hypothetical protein